MRFVASARNLFSCPKSAFARLTSLRDSLTAYTIPRRYLFSEEILGIESYKKHRSFTIERVGVTKDAFREKMDDYLASSDRGTVFSDDLKTLLSIAETDQDIDTAANMLKKYMEQQSVRFSTYQFGPIVMRMLHLLNKPDTALEMFMNEEFGNLFDQMSSFLVLMDNLFVHERYTDVIQVFDVIKARYLGEERFPRDCATLAIASHWKLGSAASYEQMLGTLGACRDAGVTLPDRALSLAALFAVDQNDPRTALELASAASKENLPSVVNIKAMAFADMDRADDSLRLVTTVMYRDVPTYVKIRQDVFPETMAKISDAVNRANQTELTNKCEIVHRDLTRTGHLNKQTIREYVLEPVVRSKNMRAGYKSRERSPVGNYQRFSNTVRHRASLLDE